MGMEGGSYTHMRSLIPWRDFTEVVIFTSDLYFYIARYLHIRFNKVFDY